MKQYEIKEYLSQKKFAQINKNIYYKENENASITVTFEKDFVVFEKHHNFEYTKNSFRYEYINKNVLYDVVGKSIIIKR